ncbi:PAS domain-containing protein [bacterium]|nr:PAS domain-containing protein [bacterium]
MPRSQPNLRDMLLDLPVVEAIVLADREGRVYAANDKAEVIYGIASDTSRPPGAPARVEDFFVQSAEYRAIRQALGDGPGPVFADALHRGAGDLSFGCHVALLGTADGGLCMVCLPEESEWELLFNASENRRKLDRLEQTVARIQKELSERTVELALEQRRLRALVEGMGEGMLAVTAAGVISEANPEACRLLALSGSPVGRPLAECWPQLEAERLELAGIRKTDSREVQLPWRGRILRVNLAPLERDSAGRCATVILLQDITEAAQADRMKAELVSIVSHELRSPLTSIKGYLDLILSGESGALPARQKEFLDIIYSNTLRLAALVEDILDLSRIEAGKVELDMSRVDVRYLCNFIHLSYQQQAQSKGLDFQLDVEPDLYISGDLGRIQQVLVNLVSNALKYTSPGDGVKLWARRAGGEVEVGVTDTGPGIEAAEQEKVFEKFYRGRGRKGSGAGGSGLGLAIARSIVEAHGGHMHLRSQPGEGSTFSFVMPAAPE